MQTSYAYNLLAPEFKSLIYYHSLGKAIVGCYYEIMATFPEKRVHQVQYCILESLGSALLRFDFVIKCNISQLRAVFGRNRSLQFDRLFIDRTWLLLTAQAYSYTKASKYFLVFEIHYHDYTIYIASIIDWLANTSKLVVEHH